MSWVAQLCSSEQSPSRLDRTVSTSSRETGALLAAITACSVLGLLCCADVVMNIPLTVISRLHSQRLVCGRLRKHRIAVYRKEAVHGVFTR